MGETMARAMPRGGAAYDVVVRPRPALVRSTALSFVFSAVPLAVALVWVSSPARLWAVVAGLVLLLAVVAGTVFVRFRTAFVGITTEVVDVRGVLTRATRVRRDAIDRLVLATTFGASPDRTARDLVALDVQGVPLFRMRSMVWDDHGLDAVVEALGVQVSEADRAVPTRDFVRQYPASRAWYEHPRGWLWPAAVAGIVVVSILAVETIVALTD